MVRTLTTKLRGYTELAFSLPQMLSDGSKWYVPGMGQWDGKEWTYELPDGLGSVRQLADSQGYLVQRYDYSPFGEMLASEGQRANSLRYTDEQWDSDAGLLYLRARWYDPATGRFTTRDPFRGFAEFPQTQHPYVYAGNDPINLTDHSGKLFFIPVLIVAAAGGFLGGMIYYTAQSYLNRDPCGRMNWNWGEAAFWGVTGTGLGALLGTGIYGGWWVGAQFGWWGVAGGGLAAQQAAQNAVQLAQNSPEKVIHIFDNPMHNWYLTSQNIPGNWNIIQQTIATNYQQIISSPTAFEVSTTFGNFIVTVRGAVVDGAVRIGTAFVNPLP
jgi:RHS repeat-associated protein